MELNKRSRAQNFQKGLTWGCFRNKHDLKTNIVTTYFTLSF